MGEKETVSIYSCSTGTSIDQVNIPDIFYAPIRSDILQFVHQSMSKNNRQPYGVCSKSGMNTSAKSWGTGRAVARVPRVPGSGTHRSGQGAIANFCRGGRIFSPTRVWRKWHHKINKNQRRKAIISAISATGMVSLVLARGHDVSLVPELPLVIESAAESINKTKDAIKSLLNLGVLRDILRKQKSKKIRGGIGKMRNRKFKNYKGPLFIYEKTARSFRNISTLSICNFNSLDLLKLAPGGHIGRLCIWSYNSFLKLDAFNNHNQVDFKEKNGKMLSNNFFLQ